MLGKVVILSDNFQKLFLLLTLAFFKKILHNKFMLKRLMFFARHYLIVIFLLVMFLFAFSYEGRLQATTGGALSCRAERDITLRSM